MSKPALGRGLRDLLHRRSEPEATTEPTPARAPLDPGVRALLDSPQGAPKSSAAPSVEAEAPEAVAQDRTSRATTFDPLSGLLILTDLVLLALAAALVLGRKPSVAEFVLALIAVALGALLACWAVVAAKSPGARSRPGAERQPDSTACLASEEDLSGLPNRR